MTAFITYSSIGLEQADFRMSLFLIKARRLASEAETLLWPSRASIRHRLRCCDVAVYGKMKRQGIQHIGTAILSDPQHIRLIRPHLRPSTIGIRLSGVGQKPTAIIAPGCPSDCGRSSEQTRGILVNGRISLTYPAKLARALP